METLPIRNRRLLVIDERQADRDRVCGLLQGTLGAESPPVAPERGYQVDTAGSAEEALGRIRSALQADAPYAVVFLGMPSVGADIPVLERFWRLDSRLQVVVHAPPADFPLLAPWAAEERLLLLGLPLQGQEVRQMAGNLSAKWNVTAHLQLQMSRMGCHPGDHPGSRPGQGGAGERDRRAQGTGKPTGADGEACLDRPPGRRRRP